MQIKRLTLAIALVAGTVPALAATIVAAGSSGDSVNKSLTVQDGTAVKDVETVNGSIDIGNQASAGEVSTVNGSIEIGAQSSVASVETVNGSIEAGAGLKTLGDVETVNGRIVLGKGSVVQGSISTVNGRIEIDDVSVADGVETVNGGLNLKASRIGGNVEMVNGRAEVLDGTVVAGDLVVHKSKGWSWGKTKPPVVVIGAGSEVRGRILVENEETRLYVHESARIGAVEGVSVQKYAGNPPE